MAIERGSLRSFNMSDMFPGEYPPMCHRTIKSNLFSMLAAMCLMFPAVIKADSLESVIFLVRHAEKLKVEDDPGLSEAGMERSRMLARALKEAGIQRVFSTDYKRTRDTAKPLADQLGLTTEFYNPRELEDFAESLRTIGERVLVVGHSNTTPEMVELLGGDPGSEIDEEAEYDRLYALTINSDGQVISLLLRYGTISEF
jgi:phosphohistidine phosphatase SixA